MKFIDDLVAGIKDGQRRGEIFGHCRKQREEYLQSRAVDNGGRYVWELLDEVAAIEDSALLHPTNFTGERIDFWTFRSGGFVLYQLVHPVRFFRDNYLRADIICSEIRPI